MRGPLRGLRFAWALSKAVYCRPTEAGRVVYVWNQVQHADRTVAECD